MIYVISSDNTHDEIRRKPCNVGRDMEPGQLLQWNQPPEARAEIFGYTLIL